MKLFVTFTKSLRNNDILFTKHRETRKTTVNFIFAQLLRNHVRFITAVISLNWTRSSIVGSNIKLSHIFPILNDFIYGLSALIYHIRLIAGHLILNKKSVIKKICGLLFARSWLAHSARIRKGLLGIDRFNYSRCISVIVTARTMQNFIGEYHFTFRHVFESWTK